MKTVGYYNGKIMPVDELSVPALDRAVYFGDGVYDVVLCRNGKPFTLDAEGFMARAICHENDHLDGHIFKDITHHMLTDEELRELDEE